MSFADVERGIDGYAKAAREGGLKLEDLQGGTFTITNGGTFGSLMSTPIVKPPQSAILGMHPIKDRAIVEHGQVLDEPMVSIALSHEHQLIHTPDTAQYPYAKKKQTEQPT